MFYIRDYNRIDWENIFYYIDGNLFYRKDNRSTGTKVYRENGTPKQIVVTYKSAQWAAHRIIFILKNGKIPDGMIIDHIDGDPFNNKIENLRLTTLNGNMQNQVLPSNNVTGFIGVQYIESKNKMHSDYYRASWMENKIQKYKSFNINTYGREDALNLAVAYREFKISLLNLSGENYSNRHGNET